MIEPLKDNVVIKPIKAPGGILLPDRPASSPQFGIVRFVGPNVVSLKPSDKVILPSWNDDEIEIDGDKYIILAEKSISVKVL